MSQEYLAWFRSYLKEIFQAPILENFLEMEIVEMAEGKVVFNSVVAEKHSNVFGFVHGGTLASIADEAMGVACITLGKRIVTIDMNISYLKGAPTGSTLTTVAAVISDGNTIIRAVGDIFSEGQLIARSQASYFVIGVFNEDDHPKPVFSKDV